MTERKANAGAGVDSCESNRSDARANAEADSYGMTTRKARAEDKHNGSEVRYREESE
jgi:hypothetical protein